MFFYFNATYRYMQIACRNSYDDSIFGCADVAVFCDVFRASTTLMALVAAGVSRIVSTEDETIVRSYIQNGYVLVSEVFAGGFDNSPAQIRRADMLRKNVVHKSTNLTTALFANYDRCHRAIIGGFVNVQRVVDYILKMGFLSVDLVAAAHFQKGTAAIEDTCCIEMLDRALKGGDSDAIPNRRLIDANIESKRDRRPEIASHYWKDVALALELNAIPYLAEVIPHADAILEIAPIHGEERDVSLCST